MMEQHCRPRTRCESTKRPRTCGMVRTHKFFFNMVLYADVPNYPAYAIDMEDGATFVVHPVPAASSPGGTAIRTYGSGPTSTSSSRCTTRTTTPGERRRIRSRAGYEDVVSERRVRNSIRKRISVARAFARASKWDGSDLRTEMCGAEQPHVATTTQHAAVEEGDETDWHPVEPEGVVAQESDESERSSGAMWKVFRLLRVLWVGRPSS